MLCDFLMDVWIEYRPRLKAEVVRFLNFITFEVFLAGSTIIEQLLKMLFEKMGNYELVFLINIIQWLSIGLTLVCVFLYVIKSIHRYIYNIE